MSPSNSNDDHLNFSNATVPWWKAVILSSMAGAMGWGIRGQYGHETGAMIAGVLVATVLVMLFAPMLSTLSSARAIAWMTIGISFGGCMTYGQTVGLTHDHELIGNTQALAWGMLGLSIKGGIWIGFGGIMLGMALSGRRYPLGELAIVLISMIFLIFLGIYLLNEPYKPQEGLLPRFYFSDHWMWEPDKALKPRQEKWGGLLFALMGLWLYAGSIRRDSLARRLGMWGILAGGIGFPGGQCLQAFHAWNPGWFSQGFLSQLDTHMNWWNMMETGFGAVFGAVLGLGLWRNRHLVMAHSTPQEESNLDIRAEWTLLVLYALALACWNFLDFGALDQFADFALTMGMLPFLAVAAGRFWPFWLCLPITLLPIAGKTVRHMVYETSALGPLEGWTFCFVIPMLIALGASLFWAGKPRLEMSGRRYCQFLLILNAWTYGLLNFAFFKFPWPWAPFDQWTSRSPNNLIFMACALGLTAGAFFLRPEKQLPKDCDQV
ncbi:MAG: hypothetical protein P8L18_06030 [Verrucomicrobiota bacterium]|nr:hypothetical protein [Verrucomicrobiota bacterium]